MTSQDLPRISAAEAARLIVDSPPGPVLTLIGADAELRAAFDALDEQAARRRALFKRFPPSPSPEAMIAQTLDLLAHTLLRLWPAWFEEDGFAACRDDTLGREAVTALARGAARRIEGLSPRWAEAAARRALAGLPPRVAGLAPALEFQQLSRALCPEGLALIASLDAARPGAEAAIALHGLDWFARHLNGPVVALFAQTPPDAPPYDRIMHGARRLIDEASAAPLDAGVETALAAQAAADWIAPWRGTPHPMSEIEQRVAKAIAADAELAPLFAFNQTVRTTLGKTPRVDLLWAQGRLVVELDGFSDHGQPHAFRADRHRDYELLLSGYAVLRLTNEEINIDLEKAMEKIRAVARLRRRE